MSRVGEWAADLDRQPEPDPEEPAFGIRNGRVLYRGKLELEPSQVQGLRSRWIGQSWCAPLLAELDYAEARLQQEASDVHA